MMPNTHVMLLVNKPASFFSNVDGMVWIHPSFTPVEMSDACATIHRTLFGKAEDPVFMYARLVQLLQLLALPDIQSHVSDLVSDVTYDLDTLEYRTFPYASVDTVSGSSIVEALNYMNLAADEIEGRAVYTWRVVKAGPATVTRSWNNTVYTTAAMPIPLRTGQIVVTAHFSVPGNGAWELELGTHAPSADEMVRRINTLPAEVRTSVMTDELATLHTQTQIPVLAAGAVIAGYLLSMPEIIWP